MKLNYDINKEFAIYENQYEVIQAFQIEQQHILGVTKLSKDKKDLLVQEGIRIYYYFTFINNEKCFLKLQIHNRINKLLYVGYLGDYIVRDKSGIYILSKDRFERMYIKREF